MALLAVPFFSQANIFDFADDPKVPSTTLGCDLGDQDPNTFKGRWNDLTGNPKDYGSYSVSGAQGVNSIGTNHINSIQCVVSYQVTFTTTYYNPDGTVKSRSTGSTSSLGGNPMQLIGSPEEIQNCQNLGNNPDGSFAFPNHTYLGTRSDGSKGCYTPQALADADDCEATDADGLTESYLTQESGTQCIKEDDGSVCPVKFNTSITTNSNGNTYYFYNYDSSNPSNCYQRNEFGAKQDNPFEDSPIPPVGECSDIGGYAVCGESPLNACDSNGNCASGCGSVDIGNGQEFMCFSGDIDGDTIPDYADRDKDGDGIPNEDDLDADGDGVEDYANNGSNVRTPHQASIESLLGEIANNTSGGVSGGSGGGSGGSGATAAQIGAEVGAEVGDELRENLTEVSDVKRQGDINAIQDAINGYTTSRDELLASEEIDLTKLIEKNNTDESLSQLQSYFNSSCTATNIGIPNTQTTIDVCAAGNKVKPYLWIVFSILTCLYCFYRVVNTARNT